MNQLALQKEMTERMTDVYESSRAITRYDASTDKHLMAVNQNARVYFRYIIPFWPPKLLLNKLFRVLLKPIMMPQVIFNEAVRDVLNDLHRSQDRQAAAHGEALVVIAELEQQVEFLSGQLASLQHKVAVVSPSGSSALLTTPAFGQSCSPDTSARG